MNCLNLAQKALDSNREDTHNALIELGFAQEKIDTITIQKDILSQQIISMKELQAENEKRLKNCYTIGNITVPLVPIGLIITGACVYNSNNQLGKNLISAGGISLIGFELVYQGGHFVFRWW